MKIYTEPFEAPTHCDCCGSELVVNDNYLECVNIDCGYITIGNVMKIIDTLDMKFIGRELVTKLYNAEVIKASEDILLNNWESLRSTINNIEGLGDSLVDNLISYKNTLIKDGIEDWKILASANLDLIGVSKAKLILSNNPDYISLAPGMEDENELSKIYKGIKGIGKQTIATLCNLNHIQRSFINNITTAFKVIPSVKVEANENAITFCHTGSAYPFDDRKNLQEFIESKGHKLSSSVTKKTDYLITNSDEETSKYLKALELGKKIITVEEAIQLIKGE